MSSSSSSSSTSSSSSETPSSSSDVANLISVVIDIAFNAALFYGCYRAGKNLYSMFEGDLEAMQAAEQSVQSVQQRLEKKEKEKITMSRYEQLIAADVIDPNDLDVTFESIGGLDHQKRDIHDLVILPLKRPDLFQTRGKLLSVPTGILLYGVPGTGKTMLAKAIAKESGAFFINLKMSTIINKWQGESEKLIRATFTLANKLSPCIIFIDEVDNFMGCRAQNNDAHMNGLKTEFMTQWDGFLSNNTANGFGVVVLGATNRPGSVDAAFLRRMPRTFEVGIPNEDQRRDILSIHLKNEVLDSSVSLARIARETEGFSGSDLKELCRAAVMLPIHDLARACPEPSDASVQLRPLSSNDFKIAREKVHPTGATAQAYAESQGEPIGYNQPSVNHEMLATAMMAGVQLGLAAKNQGL